MTSCAELVPNGMWLVSTVTLSLCWGLPGSIAAVLFCIVSHSLLPVSTVQLSCCSPVLLISIVRATFTPRGNFPKSSIAGLTMRWADCFGGGGGGGCGFRSSKKPVILEMMSILATTMTTNFRMCLRKNEGGGLGGHIALGVIDE